MRLSTAGKKFFIILAILIGGYFGVRYAVENNIIPMPKTVPSVVPPPMRLPDVPASSPVRTFPSPPAPSAVPQPVGLPQTGGIPEIRFEIWEWNAQFGALYANGGPSTTPDSLMARNGVRVHFARQDDTNIMKDNLRAFAEQACQGIAHPTAGVHFIVIMGDQAAAFFAGLNPLLRKYGPECYARIIAEVGFSWGEDKYYGPEEWKLDPQKARGGAIWAPLREGDWNIVLKWAGDNQICNNPDVTTYDPDCLNWFHAESNTAAGELFVSGQCEDRPVVRQGKRTGETKHVCGSAAALWTPADVTAAMGRGGAVSIVSTKEYYWQMPAVIIGNNLWMTANRRTVEQMVAALLDGGSAVKNDPVALQVAARISAAVYNDQTPDYWLKYYKGVVEADRTGKMVELGGSRVNDLADNLQVFGMLPGGDNIFAHVYTGFGNIVVQQYPKLVPDFPPVEEILDLSYLRAIQSRTAVVEKPDMPQFNPYRVTQKVSRSQWEINFETGKATLMPSGEHTLQEIYDQAVMTGLTVEIHGHTDNTGNATRNKTLSEARAFTIKQWLHERSPVNFPDKRLKAIGHGSEMPIAPNDTEEHRRQNRRVEIILGS